jgi:hypothetical protein
LNRHEIKALIEYAKEETNTVEKHHNISKPRVKNILENLRSALEYVAQDINNSLSKPKDRVYFPYGKDKVSFDESVKKNLKLLQVEFPQIYTIIENIQGYKINDNWLVDLCSLTNHVKHNGALDVKKDEVIVHSAKVVIGNFPLFHGGGNGTFKMTGCKIGDKTIDDFTITNGNMEIHKRGDVSPNIHITKDRKIIVGDEAIDLIPFLRKCITNIENCTNEIYTKLNNTKLTSNIEIDT